MPVRDAVAGAGAPGRPGIYVFVDDAGELLYVGKAVSLRRRLWQHARDLPASPNRRLRLLADRAVGCRWEEHPDEATAAAREADVIIALRPAFNASHRGEGRWAYVVVEPAGGSGAMRFRLLPAPDASDGQAYGCFPHLGKGVATKPAIACSDGYTALLRLLWTHTAADPLQVPSRVTRSAPDVFEVVVPTDVRPALHRFLSGTDPRLPGLVADDVPAVVGPRVRDDRAGASGFFTRGPSALRALRLRHGQRRALVSRDEFVALVRADLAASIGEFSVRTLTDEDVMLGRRARPWA